MDKLIIQNRKKENIVVVIDESEKSKGMVCIMHGMGYNKEEPVIVDTAETFKKNRYTVIRFDTTNTLGESDGNFEDATVKNYDEDFEDVIHWAKTKKWYEEPFILVGHSAGGLCMMLFSQKNPEKIKAIALISTVISGNLALEVYPKKVLEEWKEKGICEWEDEGKIKRVKWACLKEWPKYDALKNMDELKMPMMLIVGEHDQTTPVKHQKILYEKILGKKELHIIKGAPHIFKEKDHLDEIKRLFDDWIKRLPA